MAFAAPPTQSATSSSPASGSTRYTDYPMAMAVTTTIFFMWGFLTVLNDILIPHLKTVFELNYAQAMLVQFTFFGAYFLMSLPAGRLVAALGYKKGIVAGLAIAAVGAFGFWPAAWSHAYPAFLAALFVLATGITVLQVAANAYVALLGPERTSSSRLTLAQAMNSLGTTLGPWFGGLLILSAVAFTVPDAVRKAPETVQLVQTLNDAPPAQAVDAIRQAPPERRVSPAFPRTSCRTRWTSSRVLRCWPRWPRCRSSNWRRCRRPIWPLRWTSSPPRISMPTMPLSWPRCVRTWLRPRRSN
jgi:FHS family L-fucose permease-like MFS transporter